MRRKSKLQMDVSSKTGVFLNDIVNLIDPSVMIRLFSLLSLVGFAFPFVTVSCANTNSFSLSGFDMMIGKRISFVSDSLYISPQPLIIMLAAVCVLSVVVSVMKPSSLVVFLGKFASFAAIGISAAQILSFDFMANTYKKTFFGNVFIDLNVSRGAALFYIPLMHTVCLIFIFKQKNILARISTLSKEPSVYDSIMDEIDSRKTAAPMAKEEKFEVSEAYKPPVGISNSSVSKPSAVKVSSVEESSVNGSVTVAENSVGGSLHSAPDDGVSRSSYDSVKAVKSSFATQKSAGKIVQKNSDEQKPYPTEAADSPVISATVPSPPPVVAKADVLSVPRAVTASPVVQTEDETQSVTDASATLIDVNVATDAVPAPLVMPSSESKTESETSDEKTEDLSSSSVEVDSLPEQSNEISGEISSMSVNQEEQEEINGFVSKFSLSDPDKDLKASETAVDGGWTPPVFSEMKLSCQQLGMNSGFVMDSVSDSYKKEASKFSAPEEADLPSHIREIKGVSDRYKKEMQHLLCVAEAETAAAYQEALSITGGVNEDEDNADYRKSMGYLVDQALPGNPEALSSENEEPVNEMVFDPVSNRLVTSEEERQLQSVPQKEAVSSGISTGVSFVSSAESSASPVTSDSLTESTNVSAASVGAELVNVEAHTNVRSISARHRINFITDMDSGENYEVGGASSSSDKVTSSVNNGFVSETADSEIPKHSFSFISQSNDLSECIKNAKMNFAKKLSSDIKNSNDKDS